MPITQEQATLLKTKHKTDEVGVLAWEVYLAEQKILGGSDRLMADVAAVLAGDSLMADRAQSEGGQPPVVPQWFYTACDLLKEQKQTPETIEDFLKPRIDEVTKIAEANRQKADEED